MTNDIPYALYELEMARNERRIKRLAWVVSCAVAALIASNAAWAYYFFL